jgi:hypothetical protein
MGQVFEAEQYEAALIRLAFGDEVAEVVFYDPEFLQDGEPWSACAFDQDGREIGSATQHQIGNRLAERLLFDIPGERGQTVKFWLQIAA